MGKIKKSKKINWQNFIRQIIMILWGIFFFWLYLSGNLSLFIGKRFVNLTLLAGIILLVLSLAQVEELKQLPHNHAGLESSPLNHHSFLKAKWKNTLTCLLFIFPIVLYFVVNPGGLDSFATEKKGINIKITKPQDEWQKDLLTHYLEDKGKYQKLNLFQLLIVTQNNPTRANGMGVVTEGFIYKDKTMKPGQFALVRFYVFCCAADAQPVGVLVNTENADSFKENQWVQVKGKVQIPKEDKGNGNSFLIIAAEKIMPMAKPNDPYLYGSYLNFN